MSEVVVSKNATTTLDGAKTLAEIVNEIHETAVRFHEDFLGDPVEFAGYDKIANEFSTLAHEIEEAAKCEAAKLIPAFNIEFNDGNGRRQIAAGWVKAQEMTKWHFKK